MPKPKTVWFLATSKSGLGHLRRLSNIANHMAESDACPAIGLLTNATLPADWKENDRETYRHLKVAERHQMTGALAGESVTVIVVDTAIVPHLSSRDEPLVLILREMPEDRIEAFRLPGGRPWDLVIVPNPEDHWMPNPRQDFAREIAAVGWVYRRPTSVSKQAGAEPRLLIATGGGGKPDDAGKLRRQLDAIIASLRSGAARPFTVEQALATRAPDQARLCGADKIFDPGTALNDCFAAADIVVSTAGYNSVLELATTETPAMLVPTARSIDDQVGRAKAWGPRVGCFLDPAAPEAALGWLKQQIEAPARRPAVNLGPSGGAEAAQRILALL